MASTLIQNKKRSAHLDCCTDQQRMFILHMMASEEFHPTEAARKAGAKNPALQANRWMKKPHIKAILGKFKMEREERTKLTGDAVWEYLHRVLFFDPATVYKNAGDGWWYIKNLEDIPLGARQMISEISAESKLLGSGEDAEHIPMMRVKFVDKGRALEIAARHAISQQHDLRVTKVDWDAMLEPSGNGEEDAIEGEILRITEAQDGK